MTKENLIEKLNPMEEILSVRIPLETYKQYKFLKENKWNITKVIRNAIIENVLLNYKRLAGDLKKADKEQGSAQNVSWTPKIHK